MRYSRAEMILWVMLRHKFNINQALEPVTRSLFACQAVMLALFALLLLSGCGEQQTAEQAFQSGNYQESYRQYLSMAESGDTNAANYLGIHYYLGLGVERNYGLANEWFMKSALHENADAMRNLGVMYMRGLGVSQDWGRAYGWLYHAVQREHRKAEEYLGVVADYVTPNKSMQERAYVENLIKEAKRP